MKIIPLVALFCLLTAGCSGSKQPMETGNGLGGGTVGTSFSGSSGAGTKASTGSAEGVRSTGETPQ